MKTKLFRIAVLLTACVFNLSVNAQRPIVTLQHGDQMQAFYGGGAFIQAMDAAEKGDVITLAGGTYKATDITKAVTIQGAGYVSDPTQLRYRTVISGDFEIKVDEEGLSIDGIWHSGTITISEDITQATFSKCRLGNFNFNALNTNVTIDRCRIYNLDPNAHSENLYIMNSIFYYLNGFNDEDIIAIDNSFIYSLSDDFTGIIQNCVVYQGTVSSNCSMFNTLYSSYINLWTDNAAGNYYVSNDFSSFRNKFTSSDLSYWDSNSYTLTETAAQKYLGLDGTQVGIYGGAQPFTDVPSNPQIVKKEIAKQTDENGKLKVDITVEAQP